MDRITRLERQKGGINRISVYVEDRFVAGLSAKAVRDLDLSPGMVADEELISRIIREAARESALLSLARREHSRLELAGKLKQKQFPDRTIQIVLNQLEAQGQLDDRRFARAWIRRRNAYHPRGRHMLALELAQKGISSEVIDEILSELLPHTDEEQLIIDLVRKRMTIAGHADPDRFKIRLLGFLSRRGFSYDDIRRVLAEHFPEI